MGGGGRGEFTVLQLVDIHNVLVKNDDATIFLPSLSFVSFFHSFSLFYLVLFN